MRLGLAPKMPSRYISKNIPFLQTHFLISVSVLREKGIPTQKIYVDLLDQMLFSWALHKPATEYKEKGNTGYQALSYLLILMFTTL